MLAGFGNPIEWVHAASGVANSKLGKFLRGDFIFTLTFYVVRLLLIIVLTMILATLTTLAGLFDPHVQLLPIVPQHCPAPTMRRPDRRRSRHRPRTRRGSRRQPPQSAISGVLDIVRATDAPFFCCKCRQPYET